jgi:hypothetical protein
VPDERASLRFAGKKPPISVRAAVKPLLFKRIRLLGLAQILPNRIPSSAESAAKSIQTSVTGTACQHHRELWPSGLRLAAGETT